MLCFGGGIEKRNRGIESELIKSALKDATAKNEGLEHQISCAQKRETELKTRQKNVQEANEAFLLEKEKLIHSLTLDREEEADRAAKAEKENRVLKGELESKRRQMEQLGRKYEKMCAAMTALQRVVSETTMEPLSETAEPLDTSDIFIAPKVVSRAAMRESAELCLSTFKDLSKAISNAGIKTVDLKDDLTPPSAIKSLPQPSIERVKSRAKPSTHDLVAAALQGHVSDSLAYQANAVFNRQAEAATTTFKAGSAVAAVAGAMASDVGAMRDQ